MASLSQLKFAMGTSIFLAAFIFGLLVFAIVYFLQLDVFTGLVVALIGTALFILFQYAIGPTMVAASTKSALLKAWRESMA